MIFFVEQGELRAQDPVFSQFNMAPTQFNPAFAGNTYAPLIHLNSRVQWPSIDLAYNTFALSYDQFFSRYNSGVGFTILNDNAGNGILNTLKIEALYAYALEFKNDHYLKMGLGFGLVQKRLNWEKLIFPDQIDPALGILGLDLISEDLKPENTSIFYPDLSVGLLYYSPVFYAGLSLRHVNSPNEYLLEYGKDAQVGVANLYMFQSGAQIPISSFYYGQKINLAPGILYAQQAGLKQLHINTILDMGMIYAGIGFRYAFENPDAIITSFGFKSGMYKIAYSYDLTVSGLSLGSGGSHELGFIINFDHSEWFEKPGKYSDCFEVFR